MTWNGGCSPLPSDVSLAGFALRNTASTPEPRWSANYSSPNFSLRPVANRPFGLRLFSVPLLTVTDLRTSFHTRNGIYRAVDGVNFSVNRGETLGIVGESGSGKSVTCYSIMGLIPQPPGRIESGTAMFDGVDLLHSTPAQSRAIRGKRVSMIFQDPMTSLNPYLRISDQLIEPLLIHEKISKISALRRGIAVLEEVGINDAERRINLYPHEFSGGMRQRVMIAMALITRPELLIADEPTTALDVTVQAQIIELIKKMQRELGMAVIFITHDLGVVSGLCDRVQVMYAGRIVETADTRTLFYSPRHPYTRALQRSIPALQGKGAELYTIRGMPPDLSKPLPGCPFAPRCEFALEKCVQTPVQLLEVAPGHAHACLRAQQGEI